MLENPFSHYTGAHTPTQRTSKSTGAPEVKVNMHLFHTPQDREEKHLSISPCSFCVNLLISNKSERHVLKSA